jgi:hypothetical protein
MTNMKGLDMRTCRLDQMTIGLQDVRGMIVTTEQAIGLSQLMGIVIKE